MLKLTDYIGLGAAEYSDELIGLRLSTRLHIGGKAGPSYIDVLLSGVSPLALTNALGLNYIKALGATEQRNLPSGYTQVEYIESNGTAWLDTGFIANGGMVFDGKVMPVDKEAITIGSITDTGQPLQADLTRNLIAYTNGTSYIPQKLNNYQQVYRHTGTSPVVIHFDTTGTNFYCTIDGNVVVNTTTDTLTNQTTTVKIGYSDYSQAIRKGRYYRLQFRNSNGDLVRDLIPAKNSSNVISMYDLVTDTFMTVQGTGTFTAGADVIPSPDTPMDIICNNGVLKARHQSGLPLGYTLLEYLESTGTQYINLGYPIDGTISFNLKTRCLAPGFVFGSRSDFSNNVSSLNYDNISNLFGIRMGNTIVYNSTSWTINTDYEIYISNGDIKINGTTVSTTAYGTSFYSGHAYLFTLNNNGVPGASSFSINRIYYFQMLKNGVLTQNLIPCRRNSDNVLGMYDLVSQTFLTNQGTGDFVAGNPVSDTIEIYTDGTQETVTITNGGTANAEMLLKVGNYQDNQELLTGNVTKNVGIKVFDGTETFTSSTAFGTALMITNAAATWNARRTEIPICSHFVGRKSPSPTMPIDTCFFNSTGHFYFRTEDSATVFKQYLKTQYQAGTPIIIIYPLATPTTEQVTGQSLTASGNCTVTATGSLDNLELELSYKQGVTVRVQEANNENLDNQVNVTIS